MKRADQAPQPPFKPPPPPPKMLRRSLPEGLCWKYWIRGQCRFGDSCRYFHQQREEEASRHSTQEGGHQGGGVKEEGIKDEASVPQSPAGGRQGEGIKAFQPTRHTISSNFSGFLMVSVVIVYGILGLPLGPVGAHDTR